MNVRLRYSESADNREECEREKRRNRKNRDRIILDKYLPRSKRVRMCLLWAYDMAAVWICACLALGLRFDLNFSSIPASYVYALWKYGLLQMAVVTLLFYGGRLYAIMWGSAGTREMLEVVLICIIAALAQPRRYIDIRAADAQKLLSPVVYPDDRCSHMRPHQLSGTSEDCEQNEPRLEKRHHAPDNGGRRRPGRNPYYPGNEGQPENPWIPGMYRG